VVYLEARGNDVDEYAWHGVRVPKFVIADPQAISVTIIDAEVNTEVRRVMIEIFGQERYMKECGAVLVNKDEFGELYRKQSTFSGDEDFCFVKVKNSTPEPDGTFKDYFLRVPPVWNARGGGRFAVQLKDMRTAREAVAWTFGIDPQDYEPEVES